MGQRILVFEKNTAFLQELESGFGRYGAQLEIANDVDRAVAQAKAGEVDAVLVDVDAMSAPGEAFLVCKRFKSDDQLARIPFVIMGGASHAESLASHKKLKRKADDYVELPIGFDQLVDQLKPILPFDVSQAQSESAQAEGLAVDADIDAFADNAFDDLLIDEAPAAQVAAFPSTPPQTGTSADRALERDLARAQAELEELRASAQAAEERALAAERRAKAAEASRASVPPPPPTGVSSRDYLELREQLNRKDKELLSLRDEVTSRDRKLLDASDRSLELERAQAGLEDNLAGVQRQLEETVSKVAGYEVDLDAAKKRREELSARLNRADENVRRLERELDEARTTHATELSERKQAHELQVRGLEEQAATDAARMRADHAAAQERLAAGHAEAIGSLETRLRGELSEAKSAHDNAMSAVRASHVEELREAGRERDAALADQKSAAEASLASALTRAADEKASALAAAANDKANALAAAEDEKAGALASAAADAAARLEQRLAEAEAAKNSALEGLRSELDARNTAQAKERDDRHNKELAVLGRKLSEADAKGASLTQQLAELERSKADLDAQLRSRIGQLESTLETRTEERDLTNNELSAARARVSSLEQVESQLGQRVVSLESQLEQAQQHIARQTAKIASDDEILERVRKALGISIGLLEQQRQNA